MSEEAQQLLAMLASLRKQGKTTADQWAELAALLKPEPQPSLFPEVHA